MAEKKDYYVYPAIFSYDPDGITIDFPDLPGCMPCADTTEEAIHNAREALGLHLYNMEEDGDEIPTPSDPLKLKDDLEPVQLLLLIDVFMPRIRDSINNKAVTKAVTVPQWLLTAGRDADINFSQTLQDALMDKLGIKREIKRRHYKARQLA